MRIIVASTYVPFIRGGDTKLVHDLAAELTAAGHQVEVVKIPFSFDWRQLPSQTLALRLMDLSGAAGTRVDRLITVRYPSYALPHPNKVAWFIHHHRPAYDLWGTPWADMDQTAEGRHIREVTLKSDTTYLREARMIFTNSQVVAGRLHAFNNIRADGVLYPPLPRKHPFHPGEFGDYIVYVARLTRIKRQALAIEALRYCRSDVRLVLAGAPDAPAELECLTRLIARYRMEDRVQLTGWLSEEAKADLLAGCCAALYLAYGEDSYGYSSLEAFHSGKPVITLADSGGTLELIQDRVNGMVAAPNPEALAAAMDQVWTERRWAAELGQKARETPRMLDINWDRVIRSLAA
jgi:glycosyltransferase involved in cell wall biosynthesis